jgi:hypothetical protein
MVQESELVSLFYYWRLTFLWRIQAFKVDLLILLYLVAVLINLLHEADPLLRNSAGYEITCLLRNPMAYYRVQLACILNLYNLPRDIIPRNYGIMELMAK